MAGRLPWILAGGAAIVAGIAVQDSDWFSFEDKRHVERSEARETRAEADREARRLRVTVAGERNGEVDSETVRAMTKAVGDLVRTEAALALAEAGDDPAEIRAARERRDRAQALVDKLKADIERQAGERADPAAAGRDAARDAIRQQVRDEVRAEVREAVRS
jgi:hypothetical protein